MVPNDYNVNSEEISKHASEYKEEAFFDKVKNMQKLLERNYYLKLFNFITFYKSRNYLQKLKLLLWVLWLI